MSMRTGPSPWSTATRSTKASPQVLSRSGAVVPVADHRGARGLLGQATVAVVPVNEFLRYQRVPPRSTPGVQVPLPSQSPIGTRSP
jgi:hypothetical protein